MSHIRFAVATESREDPSSSLSDSQLYIVGN